MCKLTFIGARYELSELEKFKDLYQKWIEYKVSRSICVRGRALPEGLTDGLVSTHIPDVVRKMEINLINPNFMSQSLIVITQQKMRLLR